jgi:hypothetical protein
VSNALSAGDVASNKISALSANVASIETNLSDMRSDHVDLSNKVSLRLPWLNAQYRIVSDTQSVAGSALTDISGLVLTVNAGETWEIDGMLAFSTSAATVGLRFGMSVAPLSTPRLFSFTRMSGAQSATGAGAGGVMQVSGSSVLLSLGTFGVALVANPVTVKAMFNVASAGTVTFQYAGIASTAASPIHVLPGSYFKAFRIK